MGPIGGAAERTSWFERETAITGSGAAGAGIHRRLAGRAAPP
jgi:hypothetical protein